MKVAIYHNLKNGGGLVQINKIVEHMVYLGHKVKIFTYNKPQNYQNSFDEITNILLFRKNIERTISQQMIDFQPNYFFVFPCHILQAPYVLRFLPKEKTIYFFLESKREFYEKTSFDYYTLKRIISRLIRYPEKFIDVKNCKSCKHIIANSKFSQTNLRKIYQKNSFVIYPGMKPISPINIKIRNNHKFLSFGLLTMLKGHHISAQLVPSVDILGQKSHENIWKYLPKNKKIITNVKEKDKSEFFQKYSFFLASQINEPFGLTTLEAISNNCYVFGRNEGGTTEIIKDGINGTILPVNNLKKAKDIINIISKKKTITFKKTCIIDWGYTTKQVLDYIKHV